MRAVREALGKQWSAVEAFVEPEPLLLLSSMWSLAAPTE
jgi:hypothetical protein